MCLCAWECHTAHMEVRRQPLTDGSPRFSSSILWILRINLRLLGSAGSSFAPPPPCWLLARPFINCIKLSFSRCLQFPYLLGVIPDGPAVQMRKPGSAGGREARGGCQVAMGRGSSSQGSGACVRNSITFGTASIPVPRPFLFNLRPSRSHWLAPSWACRMADKKQIKT